METIYDVEGYSIDADKRRIENTRFYTLEDDEARSLDEVERCLNNSYYDLHPDRCFQHLEYMEHLVKKLNEINLLEKRSGISNPLLIHQIGKITHLRNLLMQKSTKESGIPARGA